MKILYVSDTYYPHLNGVYYFVCRVAPMIREKGHQVAVITSSETSRAGLRKIDGIDVFGVPSLPSVFYPKVRFAIPLSLKSRVRQIIEQFQPDVIHLQDHFLISKAVVDVAFPLGIPLIGTNHYMPENLTALVRSEKWKAGLEKAMWKRFSKVFNRVTVVTTPTETGAALIRPHLKVPVLAISSGIDLSTFNPYGDTEPVRRKYGIPDKPVLLFVGRLDPEKHIEEILEAAALAARRIDCCVVIVGKGLRKVALEKLAVELGISDRVIFTGFVPEADLPYFYKLSRAFIIASIAELLSLAALQGMASGLPVIAVNAGALGELVHEGDNGFLFGPGDIATTARQIETLFSDEQLCRRMSEKSLELSRAHDIHRTLESFEALYAQLGSGLPFSVRKAPLSQEILSK